MVVRVSLQQLLEVVAEFDDSGGASLGLVAWELCVDEELVAPAWQQAIHHELISPAGRDSQEQLWRLTAAGRAVAPSDPAPKLSRRFDEQEPIGSQADRIAKKPPYLQVRSHKIHYRAGI